MQLLDRPEDGGRFAMEGFVREKMISIELLYSFHREDLSRATSRRLLWPDIGGKLGP